MEALAALEATKMAKVFAEAMPEVASGMRVWSAAEAQKRFGAAELVSGAISYDAGALWPYRLVTSIYSSLLTKYPSNLSIETHTVVDGLVWL